MATKQVLAQLVASYSAKTGQPVAIESVGGVDAAKRVQAGEAFDVVLLAADAIDKLIASGHLGAGSRTDWVNSPVAVAIPTGTAAPDISTETALKQAVQSAISISYSTGPSGTYLTQLFERWSMAELVKAKLIVPPPGTPVGSLVASGQVTLGFQQLSELLNVAGVSVIGHLPSEVAYITTFSAGIPANLQATRLKAVQDFLTFLNSAEAQPIKLQHGMTPLV